MSDIRQANLDDLLDIVRCETFAGRALDNFLSTDPTSRSNIEARLLSNSTISELSDIDSLLDFYGLLEIAMLLDYVPDPLPVTLQEEVQRCLKNGALARYYEQDRSSLLPFLLRNRIDGTWLLKEKADKYSISSYQSFLSLTGRFSRDETIAEWLQLLKFGKSAVYTIDDLVVAVRDQEEYIGRFTKDPTSQNRLDAAIIGFQRFLTFCRDLDELLQETSDSRYLQSAIWHFYRHLFVLQSHRIEVTVDRILQNMGSWHPNFDDAEGHDNAMAELHDFMHTTRDTLQRLISGSYGRALDAVISETRNILPLMRSVSVIPVRAMPVERFLFTSESVTEGDLDKVADQISDAILDGCLAEDPYSRVACETLITTGMVFITGQITTKTYVDIQRVVRGVVQSIGYDDASAGFDSNTCAVISSIDKQSGDIAMGVDTGGAGDQGMMFGYACNENDDYMPTPITLAHKLTKRLSEVRRDGKLPYLRPDGRSQVTVEYDANQRPRRIDAVVVAAQHADYVDSETLRYDILQHVIQASLPSYLLDADTKYHINPNGPFVVGRRIEHAGLTGRRITVDSYGGMGRLGGGGFSGKDPTKLDRSASYMCRYIAKNIVAAGLADRCEIQLAYAIGVAEPVSVLVDTFGTAKIDDEKLEAVIRANFHLTPRGIIESLKLRRPIYRRTAVYGHFGRRDPDFTWEAIDKAPELQQYYAQKKVRAYHFREPR